MRTIKLVLILCSIFSCDIFAQDFVSGDKQVPLIELYTSEGCSSCPPADKWLSSLKHNQHLFEGFVPLAFHVDYWDYIGWEDPFASPEYSQRQRHYAHENQEATVYTPGVRKGGEEWRTWRLWGGPTSDNAPIVGSLSLSIDKSGEFKAKFDVSGNGRFQLNIAVLGLNLESKVKRGENRGKTLKHDFVVLGLSRYASANTNDWAGQINRPEIIDELKINSKKVALAAWVSEKGSPRPIQAVGGYLDSATWVSSL
jgi:hypothetical protein